MSKEKNSADAYNAISAKRLRDIMAEKNMNQKDLAEVLGTTRQAISTYMDGSTQISSDKLCKIADYFDISADWFLGRNDIRSPDVKDISINKILGLSDGAIEALKYHNEESNKSFISVINFLLEQEKPPPDYRVFYGDEELDENESSESIEEINMAIFTQWRAANFQILKNIMYYLRTGVEDKRIFDAATDEVTGKTVDENWYINNIRMMYGDEHVEEMEINLNKEAIINNIYFNKINDLLKKAKEQIYKEYNIFKKNNKTGKKKQSNL